MKSSFFKSNRDKLIQSIGDRPAVFTAYTRQQKKADMFFKFEQEANFWWLTGVEAPDWWLVIESGNSYLVAPDIDTVEAVFDGGLSWQDAKKISGVDKVISSQEAKSLIKNLAQKHQAVCSLGLDPYARRYNFALNPAPEKIRRYLKRTFNNVIDCRLDLAKLRAIKQPEEIRAIKQAVKLTERAFNKVKQNINNYTYEFEIEADFTHHFKSHSADHAYDPIVASGLNACTLHYHDNLAKLPKNSLVLIDIGASFGGYAADITRTYAFGQPTKRQVQIHTAVVDAQKQIIDLLKPELSVKDYQESVDKIMKQTLLKMGLLKSFKDEKSYRKYFPHAVSHGLGIDVHDSLGRPEKLLPGMLITVEPGIYLPAEKIGVRIEDDVLITDSGAKILSGDLSNSL